jgi:hypothetical protein
LRIKTPSEKYLKRSIPVSVELSLTCASFLRKLHFVSLSFHLSKHRFNSAEQCQKKVFAGLQTKLSFHQSKYSKFYTFVCTESSQQFYFYFIVLIFFLIVMHISLSTLL